MSRRAGHENPVAQTALSAVCGFSSPKCSKDADLPRKRESALQDLISKKEQIVMRIVCGAIVLLCFAPASVPAKEKIRTLSWGDVIWQHRGQGIAQIDTPEKIRESIKTWKAKGVDKVHFRVDDFRILLFHPFRCKLPLHWIRCGPRGD